MKVDSFIEAAIQTEIPLIKKHLSDNVWAERGKGIRGERFNRINGERYELTIQASRAETIAHGFATISRFFAGVGQEAAEIYDELVRGAPGVFETGTAQCFEDQYICSGGQFYELISGYDRLVADLRPVFEKSPQKQGLRLGICCHPYDLCTELIARESGVIITDENGRLLSALLAVEPDVAWIGYANPAIRNQIEPILSASLKTRGLLNYF